MSKDIARTIKSAPPSPCLCTTFDWNPHLLARTTALPSRTLHDNNAAKTWTETDDGSSDTPGSVKARESPDEWK